MTYTGPERRTRPVRAIVTPPPPPPPLPPTSYDMLDWMCMDPSLIANHYLAGANNDMCCQLDPIDPTTGLGRLYWKKSHSKGFPWDIEYYDLGKVYHVTTESSWTDPHTCKQFNSTLYGLKGLWFPRFWVPGQDCIALDSTFHIYTSCAFSTPHNLGKVTFTLTAPTPMSFAGNLTPNLPTLIIGYFWSGGAKRERYKCQKPYGLVEWDTADLQTDGSYKVTRTSTFNQLTTGVAIPAVNPCGF